VGVSDHREDSCGCPSQCRIASVGCIRALPGDTGIVACRLTPVRAASTLVFPGLAGFIGNLLIVHSGLAALTQKESRRRRCAGTWSVSSTESGRHRARQTDMRKRQTSRAGGTPAQLRKINPG